MSPQISVIIPCYNRANILRKTLSAYDRQIPVDGGFEIIAIDDGSTDGTLEILKEWSPKGYDLRYLTQSNAGPGTARNKGVEIARGKFILFTGDDIIPSKNFISSHLKKHTELNNSNFAVLGRTDWDTEIPISTVMQHITGIGEQQFGYYFLRPETFVDFRHFYTSNISLRKEILLSCDHLFDTDFERAAFEDVELGYRLEKKGMKIYYTDKAFAVHNHFYSAKAFCQRQYNAGSMSNTIIKKHPELKMIILNEYLKSRLLIPLLPSISINKVLLFSNGKLLTDFEDAIIRLVMHYEFSDNPYLDAIYLSLFNYFFIKGYAENSLNDIEARNFCESLALFNLFPDVVKFINSSRNAMILLPLLETSYLQENFDKLKPLSLYERSIIYCFDKPKKIYKWIMRRKRLYDTALKSGRINVNEGWRSFWLKFKEERILKKKFQQKDQQIKQKEQEIQQRHKEINKSFVKKFHEKIKNIYILAKVSLQEEGLRILIIRSINFMKYGQGVLDKKDFLIRKKKITFGESAYDLKNIDYNFKPKITIIVPNYNHEKFLRQRLDSIFSQTYHNYEVILLDDNSFDNSREILIEYANKYKDNTRYIFNEINSGSVFNQWKRGIEEAKGELIWIAESDDYCTDNFISSLVPFFSDESVMIAYCRSVFEKNGAQIWDLESYLADIDQNKWKSDFIETAHKIVNYAMAKKNIIPNMSSAMFRNPGKMSLLSDEKWKSLRFCGDWVFYLHIMRGGAIAYTTKAINYYRQHENNTSTKLQGNDIYYIEHEYVAMKIAELYAISPKIFENQRKNLQDYWNLYHKKYDEVAFDACYDIKKIKDHQKSRKPNIAMFGYSFAAGGGETFPIILANILKENGYGITFFDCNMDTRVEGVRKMLKQSIPVIKLSDFNKMTLFVKSLGIEILHSHHAWVDSNINQMIEYIPECSHMVTLHGMYEMIEEQRLEASLSSLCAGVDQWVYTTDKNIEVFKRFNCYNENKFVKIGNALVRSDIKSISRETLDIDEDAFVLCLVSRAVPEKGWEEAIRCVGQARFQSGRDIQLIIIGDGGEKNRLQNQAPVYVKFLGFKSNIRDYYAMTDMGFLPSRFKGESFPLTIIDCLFSGKPVLASNIGEINNMLRIEGEKYAGVLFDLNNWTIPEKELTALIIKCAKDVEFYNGMLAEVEKAASRFDINNVFLKYCACYDRLFKHTFKD